VPNKTAPIPAVNDLAQAIPIINKNFAELDQPTAVYSDRNGVPSISIGLGSDGSSRIRVARAGVDVTKATDDQLLFNSAQNTFKVVNKLTGSFTLTSAATPTSTLVTITHSLGYVPFTLSNVNLSADTAGGNTGIFPIPFFSVGTGGGTTNVFIIRSYVKVRSVSTTDIVFEVGTAGGPATITGAISVYVLQETAT
jgi:hypothetical protein